MEKSPYLMLVNDYLRFALKILFTRGILRRVPLWFSGTYSCFYSILRSSILKIRILLRLLFVIYRGKT